MTSSCCDKEKEANQIIGPTAAWEMTRVKQHKSKMLGHYNSKVIMFQPGLQIVS